MPIELYNLEDLETYVEDYQTPIFWYRNGNEFTILAGKVAWKGTFDDDAIADAEEAYLIQKGGKRVKGWRELEGLFQ